MLRPVRRRLHRYHHRRSSLLLRPRLIVFDQSFRAVATASTSTVRLTIMVTSTVGADAATETLSAGLPNDDTNSLLGTAPPTSSFPIATTMTTTMTTESTEIECLDERAATPKPHRYRGSGSSRGQKSNGRCQIESSSASTSGLAWWELIPIPPALVLWPQCTIVMFWSVYAFAKTVLGYIRCRPQRRNSGRSHYALVVLGVRVGHLVFEEKESGTC